MECLVSFAQCKQDIILAQALNDIAPDNIFWIDVGANDPVDLSVTLYFYLKGGHGINIEPQPMYQKRYALLRERDINLMVGIGEAEGKLLLYGSGPYATMKSKYAEGEGVSVEVITLTKVFQDYVPENQEVHFLKLDVEDFECECIMGLDLSCYKPWIICTECNLPDSYVSYEPKLLKYGYRFVYYDGLNRYYVLGEHTEIISKFDDMHRLDEFYEIVSCEDTKRWMRYEQSTSWKMTAPLRKVASALRGKSSKEKTRKVHNSRNIRGGGGIYVVFCSVIFTGVRMNLEKDRYVCI